MSDLPPGWEWATLGEIVEVLDYLRVPVNARERAKRRGRTPYYGATGQVGWIDEPIFNEELVLLGEDGAPFLDTSRPKAYRISGPSWVNNHAHVLRAATGLSASYLVNYLNSFDYRDAVTGTTRLKLTKAKASQISVALAPEEEQRRIADVLERHLASVQAASCALELARRRLEGLERRIIENLVRPRTTNPTSECHEQGPSPSEVRDGFLPKLPERWRWMRLHEVAEVVGGVTKDTVKQSDPTVPLAPYLRVANVQRGRLDLREVAEIRVPAARAEKLRLLPGDVLLNEGGDRDKLGRGWVWEGQIENCIHQNHVFRARIRDGVLHPKLLALHANSFGHWFEANGKQSVNLASISLRTIKQLPVPVPPAEEQEAIVGYIEARLAETARLRDALRTAEALAAELRRSVLADAFAGRLVPQDPGDEPASVLLQKIRTERPSTNARRKA